MWQTAKRYISQTCSHIIPSEDGKNISHPLFLVKQKIILDGSEFNGDISYDYKNYKSFSKGTKAK